MFLGKSRGTSDITMGGTIEADIALDKPDKTEMLLDKKDTTDPPVDKKVKEENTAATDSIATATKKVDGEAKEPSISTVEATPRPVTSSGWLGGWLGRPTVVDGLTATKPLGEPEIELQNETTQTAPPTSTESEPASTTIVCEEPPTNDTPTAAAPAPAPANSSTWFGLWTTAAPSTTPEALEDQTSVKFVKDDPDTIMNDVPPVDTKTDPAKAEPASGSSWAFWSTTDTTKAQTTEQTLLSPVKDQGELAVGGEASETRPEPVQAVKVKNDRSAKPGKRGRPVSAENTEIAKKAVNLEPASTKVTPSQSPAPGKTAPPNLLMPSVKGTYHLVENPSILQQITQLLLRGQQKPARHVSLVKEPPKIRKSLAIGIHGLFPAPLLRTVIGQPTGTSVRFANHAADAIRRWGDQHGCADCEIEKVALEGEGKIAERVDNLWKLLLNWMDHVRKADFIMFACHSQGVPVALMLIAKLIEFGVVSTGKIGVCAMG